MSNVPLLRFKEFDSPWINTRLGRYFTEYREKSTVQDQHPVMTSSNKGLVLQLDYLEKEELLIEIISDSMLSLRELYYLQIEE